MSSRSPSTDPAALLYLGCVGGLLGVVIGVIVGSALYSGPTGFLESNVESWWVDGGAIGLPVGAIALPLFVWWLDGLGNRRRRAKR
jgi:hypothetical protein